ncbi:histidinol-phosphate phosphatase [Propioniferax innocua]|uniref:Histidinol-phosphatase n=2 Tax=Propioniferax innocua TaxID=1753 RepID=A0A542ZBA3_9ACTN|nr:histidinol-phosphate phosphatase [Propioniferax innocua]
MLDPQAHADDLGLAHMLADSADQISAERFGAQDLHVESKPDATPVTDADLAVERTIRSTLGRLRSRDAIHGEEFSDSGESDRRWIIDPIDGTKNFLRGVPVFATLIALMVEDEVALGVVSAPALGQRWWASRGAGAWMGPRMSKATRLQVSGVHRLADASLSYGSLGGWVDEGRGRGMGELMRSCWRTRAYGDFWHYMLVAQGAVDIATEPELNLYDMAACQAVVTEAGGRFTNIDGLDGVQGPGAVATNGHLHGDVIELLRPDEA